MYFVKQVSVATQDNPNYAGEIAEAIFGKDQRLVSYSGSHAERNHLTQSFYPMFARDYGFKRKCDAKRSYCYKNPENSKYWKSEVSIVEIDC